jgi:hypothetical protein
MKDLNGRDVAVGDEILLGHIGPGFAEWQTITALESVKMSRVGGEPALTDVAVTSGGKFWTLGTRQTRKAER